MDIAPFEEQASEVSIKHRVPDWTRSDDNNHLSSKGDLIVGKMSSILIFAPTLEFLVACPERKSKGRFKRGGIVPSLEKN